MSDKFTELHYVSISQKLRILSPKNPLFEISYMLFSVQQQRQLFKRLIFQAVYLSAFYIQIPTEVANHSFLALNAVLKKLCQGILLVLR